MSSQRILVPDLIASSLDADTFSAVRRLSLKLTTYDRAANDLVFGEMLKLGVHPLLTPIASSWSGSVNTPTEGSKFNLLGLALRVGALEWLNECAAKHNLGDYMMTRDAAQQTFDALVTVMTDGVSRDVPRYRELCNFFSRELLEKGVLRLDWPHALARGLFFRNNVATSLIGEVLASDMESLSPSDVAGVLLDYISKLSPLEASPAILGVFAGCLGEDGVLALEPSLRAQIYMGLMGALETRYVSDVLRKFGFDRPMVMSLPGCDPSKLDALRQSIAGSMNYEAADPLLRMKVEHALACGVGVDDPLDASGSTMLMRSMLKGDLGVSEFLLKNGANVNAKDANGDTVSHHLCRRSDPSNYHLMRPLVMAINAGVDLSIRNKSGALASSGYSLMSDYCHIEMGKQSRHGHSKLEILLRAGAYDVASDLVRSGCPLDTITDAGQTLASFLWRGALLDDGLVGALAERGYDFNSKFRAKVGPEEYIESNLALLAARFARWEEVEILHKRGCLDLSGLDSQGKGLVGYAVKAGDVARLAMLLDAGADVNQKFGRKSLLQTAKDEKIRDYIRSTIAARSIVGEMACLNPEPETKPKASSKSKFSPL